MHDRTADRPPLTGITCWGLWRFAVAPTGNRFLGFLGMYAVAVALHTTWDGLGGRVTYAIVGAISIGLLLLGLKKAQRQDNRIPVPA